MENMTNQTKTCTKCGRTMTLSNFYQRGNGKYYSYCKDCAKEMCKKSRLRIDISKPIADAVENPLRKFTPRELMCELKRRGYTGKLYIQQVADLEKL